MKKILPLILTAILILDISGCGRAETVTEPITVTNPSAAPPVKTVVVTTPQPAPTPDPFPYVDEAGRTRYRLMINGELVETEHLPFSLPGEKGAYYPLADVLDYFGVPCLMDENTHYATGRVNGSVFTAQGRLSHMTVGETSLDAEVTPHYIDGCLYVPSFLFMELMGAIVDFTPDRSAVTLDADLSIDTAASTADGLAIPVNTYGNGNVRLTIETGKQSACAKLFAAEATGRDDVLMRVLIDPYERATLHFSAGTYILKLAYGDTWLGDEEAFGSSGSYSTTDAYTFEAGGEYELETSTAQGDFHGDDLKGFTGN